MPRLTGTPISMAMKDVTQRAVDRRGSAPNFSVTGFQLCEVKKPKPKARQRRQRADEQETA